MSTQIDGNFRTFGSANAISAFRFVQPDTTTAGFVNVAVTGATKAIGVTQEDVVAGGFVAVKLFHPTFFATVSGVAAVGDVLKFDATGHKFIGCYRNCNSDVLNNETINKRKNNIK